MRVLVICGLRREAAIAEGPGIVTVAGGGDRASLEARLAALGETSFDAIISFGLAGALSAGLEPGSVVMPGTVRGEGGRAYRVAPTIREHWLPSFDTTAGKTPIPFSTSEIVGSDVPILTRAAKRELGIGGAGAVDMESHIAAAYAERRSIPFAALRVISDPADHDLPPLAGSAMRPDGSIDVLGVAAGVIRQPSQLPALIRTARDANAAFRTLGRVRGLLRLGGLGLLGLDL